MRNTLTSVTVAGLAAILLAGPASAQAARTDNSGNSPAAGWMSVGEIVAKIEGQGYSVREVEIDDQTYEVKAVDANGMRVEADLDPTTGKPVGQWKQDD